MWVVKCSRAWPLMAALVALGCGDQEPGREVSPLSDGGMETPDTGPVTCTADMAGAASTAGCNGGFDGEPAMNAPGGRCELGTDTMPAGSCTTERSICMGDLTGSGAGWCVVLCDAPEAYVDAQECPAGHRCFRQGEGENAFGLCFRDCDAEHPCPESWACNGEGACEEQP